MTTFSPPPGYRRAPSAVNGIDVYAPVPAEAEAPEEVEFHCPQCGGTTAYSVAEGGLTCAHCGYHQAPQKEVVGTRAKEHEFTLETLEQVEQGWGSAELRKDLECQNCGAITSVPTEALAHTCPFCASNKVVKHEGVSDILRPRFLIPFKIDQEACKQAACQWLGSSWMAPNALRETAKQSVFTGMYLPFWTFDSHATAGWKAEVGHTVTETYYEKGQQKTRLRTVWRWESGQVQENIDDLIIPGTSRTSSLLLNRINHFDFEELCPYEPQYLAGYQAQAFDLPLDQAWELARQKMREQVRKHCEGEATSSQIRNFSMDLDFAEESWRYILLPVYLTAYRYENRSFQVILNAQTGEVTGQRPVDWKKVWLVIAALLAPGLGLSLVGMLTVLLGGVGVAIGGIGFVLLLIGLVISAVIFFKAQGMDDV